MTAITEDDIADIIRMRRTMHPRDIARATGRSEAAVNKILSQAKHRRGIEYPRLRHGNLKYDRAKVGEWRTLAKMLSETEIGRQLGVNRAIISRKFAQEIRGELRF